MIDAKQTSHYARTAEVVYGQICAALVFVLEPGESSALAGFLVAS
jgi:hypothetical protein